MIFPKGFRQTDFSLMALLFMHAVGAIITGSLLTGIIADFELSYTSAGLIETVRNYAIFFVLIVTVKILRVFRAKTLFIWSRVGIAAGYIISALSGDYTFFIFGVVLAGLGAGFVESLIAQTITNLHQHEGNVEKFFNIIQGVFSLAVIIVPLLYGYAMENGIEWQTLFLYTAALPLAVAIILQFTDLPEVEAEEGGYMEALKAVFSKTAGRLFSVGLFIAGALENVFYVWSATYIALYLNNNQQYATTGLAIFGAFMFIARFATAFLPGKKTAYNMMFLAAICGLTSSIMLFTMEGISVFYISLALAGFAVGPLWPSLTGLISDLEPTAKAGYFIVIALMGYVGYANAPVIMGFVGDMTGDLKNGFYMLPIGALVLFGVVYGLKRLALKNGSYYK